MRALTEDEARPGAIAFLRLADVTHALRQAGRGDEADELDAMSLRLREILLRKPGLVERVKGAVRL